tara:strand:+ start:206 stop:619 length:414 start_codon:yes stop_codon:yes gene_type:complete
MSLIKTKEKLNKAYSYGFGGYLGRDTSDRSLDGRTDLSDIKITETESRYRFELKLPGYIKDDFNFYFSEHGLVVTTEKSKNNEVQEKDGVKNTKHSYCYPSAYFKKNIQIPKDIVKEKILIDYKDEILSFDLLKSTN